MRVLAYCLMTNHVHFIARPGTRGFVAVLFGRSYGRYSQALNIRRGRCGHLWQARFHSCAMSPAHVEAGLRYVGANPCRAGMVEHPEQYRWSSAAPHLLGEKDRSGVLDLGDWERAGGVETWAELHAKAENSSEIIELRKCTYGGRPFGDAEFIEEMEQRFQRKWSRGSKNVGISKIRIK